MLNEFYAVTMHSIWYVRAREENGNRLLVVKIAAHKECKKPAGARLQGGDMLSIGKKLMMYIPEGGGFHGSVERNIYRVSTLYWGGSTSPVVALFKDRQLVFECFDATDAVPCDPRWTTQTKEVLSAIGEDHPDFEICRYGDRALFPSEVTAK
ncbi:MAG: hypothetical protein HY507_00835 [Candidatus Zambryskibacteria bacterium]|nr:hypothetical protein [Candidatus Zambryskibacteria bacterium]